jgi:uncharacterized protein (UPF0332 family)
MVGMIGEHFVKTGRLSSEMGRMVSLMQRNRQDADYVIGAVFTDVQAAESVENAERFLAEARRLVALLLP